MSAERVPGEAGVIRVLGQNGGSAPPDSPHWTSQPRPARRDRAQSEAVWGSLVTLLAVALPDPQEVADALLDRFGCLAAVLAASEADLVAIPGVTAAAARLLGAVREAASLALTERFERDVIGNWAALEHWTRLNMGGLSAERLVILYLDRKNGLIRHETLGEGTVDHVPLYPREVARRALVLSASAVILAHNHPSGDPTPSPLDVEVTRKVADGLALFEIALHDHAIVARSHVVSMRAQGLL